MNIETKSCKCAFLCEMTFYLRYAKPYVAPSYIFHWMCSMFFYFLNAFWFCSSQQHKYSKQAIEIGKLFKFIFSVCEHFYRKYTYKVYCCIHINTWYTNLYTYKYMMKVDSMIRMYMHEAWYSETKWKTKIAQSLYDSSKSFMWVKYLKLIYWSNFKNAYFCVVFLFYWILFWF